MKRMRISVVAALTLLAAGNMAVLCHAEEKATEMASESGLSQVASADEMSAPVDVVDEDMNPIYADSLNDGTYLVEVLSSSSMFRIVDCRLTVKDGAMTAAMTMSSDGYLMLYMGTGEEAVRASEDDYIMFEMNEDGKQVYTVPVTSLDQGISCAAWSKRKEKWYDRTLVFSAASLPQDAWKESSFTTADELGLEDGQYQVDVKLDGGSGKTAVESPALMTVTGGKAFATIVWGSPKYDYMVVDGEKYEPVNTEGNAAFEIPVTVFDRKMPVIIDTVALGAPHELEYSLYFDSASIAAR